MIVSSGSASRIAWRSELAPLSFVFVTVMVAADTDLTLIALPNSKDSTAKIENTWVSDLILVMILFPPEVLISHSFFI